MNEQELDDLRDWLVNDPEGISLKRHIQNEMLMLLAKEMFEQDFNLEGINMKIDSFVPGIVWMVPCGDHMVPVGFSCWEIKAESGHVFEAICNNRALNAGFNGYVTPESRQQGRKTRRFPVEDKTEKFKDPSKGRYARFQPSHRR